MRENENRHINLTLDIYFQRTGDAAKAAEMLLQASDIKRNRLAVSLSNKVTAYFGTFGEELPFTVKLIIET